MLDCCSRCFWLQWSESGLTGWFGRRSDKPEERGQLLIGSLMFCLCEWSQAATLPNFSDFLHNVNIFQLRLRSFAAVWTKHRRWQQGNRKHAGQRSRTGRRHDRLEPAGTSLSLHRKIFWGCVFQFWLFYTDYNLPPSGWCWFVPVNLNFSINGRWKQ